MSQLRRVPCLGPIPHPPGTRCYRLGHLFIVSEHDRRLGRWHLSVSVRLKNGGVRKPTDNELDIARKALHENMRMFEAPSVVNPFVRHLFEVT